jgi:hypothetical protein
LLNALTGVFMGDCDMYECTSSADPKESTERLATPDCPMKSEGRGCCFLACFGRKINRIKDMEITKMIDVFTKNDTGGLFWTRANIGKQVKNACNMLAIAIVMYTPSLYSVEILRAL